MKIFLDDEYTEEQAIEGVKSIDNWFAHNPKTGWNKLIEELSSAIRPRHQASPLRCDQKFGQDNLSLRGVNFINN